MKILVPVKRVVDYNVKVAGKADGSGVEIANVKMSMNPFDEIAVEEAVRLKEAGTATEIVVVSVGPQRPGDPPHRAGHGRRPRHPGQDRRRPSSRSRVAKMLKAVVEGEPGLVILGKQAIDDDSNQTGQMLAALLGWPQGTFASKIGDRAATPSRHARGRRRPGDGRRSSCRRSSPPTCASTSRATPRCPTS